MTLLLAFSILSASAEDVAAVLAVDGTVEVVRAAGAVDATPRLSLDRADRIHTGDDGAVILLLSNNRLVRVDEDLDLAVKDIVLLGAAKTSVPVSEQLDDLLYPGERDSMRGIDDAERIAGWQARLSAATAVPAQSVARAVATESSLAGATEDSYSSYDDGDPGYTAATVASDSPAEAPAAEREKSDLPMFDAAEVSRLFTTDLASCAKEWRKSGGLAKGAKVLLHFRVEDGRIVRIVGDGGVTPARCLRDEILGGGAAATFDVELTLP